MNLLQMACGGFSRRVGDEPVGSRPRDFVDQLIGFIDRFDNEVIRFFDFLRKQPCGFQAGGKQKDFHNFFCGGWDS